MKPSAGAIKISESAKRLDVDNRISLSFYYRIAHNLLRQEQVIDQDDRFRYRSIGNGWSRPDVR